ncbi:uncharacterized protein BDV14DRAFT_171783 [Aspergillus stella-maris]|uniref:uncharacterized protein n=1 Tax=Aspergillus stella-maris TaxID=1810926 RepID=UPI003CCE5365
MQRVNSFFKTRSFSQDKTATAKTNTTNTNGTPQQHQQPQQQTSPKARRRSNDPVLTAEDEAFLRNVTAENPSAAAPAPAHAPSATQDIASASESTPAAAPQAVGDQMQEQPISPSPADIPIPMSPAEEFGKELGEQELEKKKSLAWLEAAGAQSEQPATGAGTMDEPSDKAGRSTSPEKKKRWSIFWKKDAKKPSEKEPETVSPAQTTTIETKDTSETKEENEDMTEILDKLNLAADNNRVFSISDETQELLRKFKLIFKDLINGVPTAYHDLEMLLTNGNRQLQDTYSNLPSFLQKLIEKLPERWTESLAPEMIAVAAERASKSGVNVDNIGKAAAAANKMGIQVPSLKELVGKPAAIVGMLRSIMAFLRARFPAVLGMNVLWSLALFILLFVLWYCHKRGREVRLENERLVTEEEIEKMNQESSEGGEGGAGTEQIRSTETLTTTAAQGASPAEIREGIKEAQRARERKALALTSPGNAEQASAQTPSQEQSAEDKDKEDMKENKPMNAGDAAIANEPIKPTRSKSILSMFGRSGSSSSTPTRTKSNGTSNVQVYPGT